VKEAILIYSGMAVASLALMAPAFYADRMLRKLSGDAKFFTEAAIGCLFVCGLLGILGALIGASFLVFSAVGGR